MLLRGVATIVVHVIFVVRGLVAGVVVVVVAVVVIVIAVVVRFSSLVLPLFS